MDKVFLKSLISRYPALELSIQRLYRSDPDFRMICEDMEMADSARVRWKERHMPERAEEYQQIFDRLQDEFLDYLTRKSQSPFCAGNDTRRTGQ